METLRIEREVTQQQLQRDHALELGVAREIDLAHAAGTQSRHDRVTAHRRAGQVWVRRAASGPVGGNFEECVGFDISETMIAKAKELNAAYPQCKFVSATDPDNHFDLIYSNIVLQHLPSVEMIERTIAEFMRILKPGGLAVFQLLSFVPLRYRLQPTRRLYGLLRTLGLRHNLLYNRLGLTPIRSNFLPEKRVVQLVANLSGKCLAIERSVIRETSVRSATYMVTK